MWSRGERERWEGDVLVKEQAKGGEVKELDRKLARAWRMRDVMSSLMVALLVGLVGAFWVLVMRRNEYEYEGRVRLDGARGTLRLSGLGY